MHKKTWYPSPKNEEKEGTIPLYDPWKIFYATAWKIFYAIDEDGNVWMRQAIIVDGIDFWRDGQKFFKNEK